MQHVRGYLGLVCGVLLASSACAPPSDTEVERLTEALGSNDLVLSQVYGGGGNSGATLKNDFIEIFNRGTSAVNVSGWSVQYTSATGSAWSTTALSGSIQPGHYYLVQEAAGGGGTTNLPTADATGTIAMSLSSGKVALVRSTAALSCNTACVPSANIADFVGYGSSANAFEGGGPTPTLTNTTAAQRGGVGCTDTDSNAADFATAAPAPRNSSSPVHSCGGGGTGGSSGGGAGAGGSGGGGTPPTLPSPTLTPIAMNDLSFGAFGDIRPANPNDTANYPDFIVSKIFSGLEALGVTLAVDAGDHCFQSSISSGSYCHTQFVSHFMADKTANYMGKLLPTMGNHEGCGTNAATAGNCTSWSSGLVHDYLIDIVQPTTGQSSFPYYSVVVYGPWGTAKFVHVAANAWTSAQNTWLTNTLNVSTTYTFVLRHEPASDARAAGVSPSEGLYATHYSAGELTLSITGHTHLIQLPNGTQPYGDPYGATQPYEVIIGNAGAPLDAGPYYGFAILTRRQSDGAIVVQAYKAVASNGTTALNNAADTSFRFAINADGSSNANTTLP